MAKEYNNDMSGVLFKIDEDKRKNDKSPHYSGKCQIEGKDYRITGWIKESKKTRGFKFISFAFEPADEDGDRSRGSRDRNDRDDRRRDDDRGRNDPPQDSDIPF